ncbi:MAG: DUF1843 domain-containing protein [Bradyrhizobium sp.]
MAIGGAIASSSTTVDELVTLRSHAQAIVDGQGDLASAVAALDKEIAKRGGPAGTKSAPPQASTPGERFVVQIDGLPIPANARQKIEQSINDAVKTVLASHDSGGDLVVTPLSRLNSFGGRVGGATAGMLAYPPKAR